MTPDVQKYYEDYFELFSTDGWKQLMQDVEGNKETFKIESIENNESLKNIQGQLYVLNMLLGFESMIRTSYENILEEESQQEHD